MFPLMSLQTISGLIFFIWNSLLYDEVPIIDFKFNSLNFFLPIDNKISLGSFLSKNVSVISPFDSNAGMSLSAWIAISIFLFNNSFSILLENKPLPPNSDSLLSFTKSPFVVIGLIIISSSFRLVFLIILSLAIWA